jgi:hypothetical protein
MCWKCFKAAYASSPPKRGNGEESLAVRHLDGGPDIWSDILYPGRIIRPPGKTTKDSSAVTQMGAGYLAGHFVQGPDYPPPWKTVKDQAAVNQKGGQII